MKTRVVYKPSADILPAFEILNARCTCPARRVPAFCKHIFAQLLATDDYIRQEMYFAPTERLHIWAPTKANQKRSDNG
ncbi:hypothetical protein NPIL_495751 [Nephila pilipes]|uniref:SWIM-type domain-containing protein n=1 Tax=Nephila pilipes TaxID=299642 RepID=A0A8X6U6H7_NEPPI|nr:hypothetical protein NPIL_495751 [Nephila pilipes]